MSNKTLTSSPVVDQHQMTEPTKSIVQCCQERKRKATETQLLTQRLRVQAKSVD
jgi:hypothetical protein